MDINRKEEILRNFQSVILTAEEFRNIVKKDYIIYYMTSCYGKPNSIIKIKVLNFNYENDEANVFEFIDEHGGGFTNTKYITDFFWGCKCVFLNEDDANNALEILLYEYENDMDWKNESNLLRSPDELDKI